MQQFSVDRPNSGQHSHDWLTRGGSFLYGWLVEGQRQLTEDRVSGNPLKIGCFPPRNCLMIGCSDSRVNWLSYQCPQRGLANATACWLALQYAAIHNTSRGHMSMSVCVCVCLCVCVCVCEWDCIPSITFPLGRCAAKPCQQALTPHYSKPGRKWVLEISHWAVLLEMRATGLPVSAAQTQEMPI